MAPLTQQLTWSAAIATYDRPDSLRECVQLLFKQTRAPKQIVIVDSSPEFNPISAAEVARWDPTGGQVYFMHQRGSVPQLTVQRNEAIAQIEADIVFILDDDSLLFKACAERVLETYESVGAEAVAVMPGLTLLDPMAVGAAEGGILPVSSSRVDSLKGKLNDWLKGPFFPERNEPRTKTVSAKLPAEVQQTWDLHGCRMTVRTEVANRHRFDENLVLNCHDDRDFAWRILQDGAILSLNEPLLFHKEALRSDEPRQRFVARAAWLHIHTYLARKWAGEDNEDNGKAHARRFAQGLFVHELILFCLGRSKAGRFAGVRYVRSNLHEALLSCPLGELEELVREHQKRIRQAGQQSTS